MVDKSIVVVVPRLGRFLDGVVVVVVVVGGLYPGKRLVNHSVGKNGNGGDGCSTIELVAMSFQSYSGSSSSSSSSWITGRIVMV